MKILQYLLSLIALIFLAFFVFAVTQDSHFEISKKIYVSVPKSTVFSFINEYKNAEIWQPFAINNANLEYKYPETTSGLNAFMVFTKNGNSGKSKIIFVKENTQIDQVSAFSGIDFQSKMIFKDSIYGTKIEWKIRAEVSFYQKIKAIFQGGVGLLMKDTFDKSSKTLQRVLEQEINHFSIKNNGIVSQKGTFYIAHSLFCNRKNFDKNLQKFLPKLSYFFKNNKLKMNGKPFLIAENWGVDSLKLKICGPLRDSIFISNPSDMSVGFLSDFSGYKTTLKGDYSHFQTAQNQSKMAMKTNGIVPKTETTLYYIFVKSIFDTKRPSLWETAILTSVTLNNETLVRSKIIKSTL